MMMNCPITKMEDTLRELLVTKKGYTENDAYTAVQDMTIDDIKWNLNKLDSNTFINVMLEDKKADDKVRPLTAEEIKEIHTVYLGKEKSATVKGIEVTFWKYSEDFTSLYLNGVNAHEILSANKDLDGFTFFHLDRIEKSFKRYFNLNA